MHIPRYTRLGSLQAKIDIPLMNNHIKHLAQTFYNKEHLNKNNPVSSLGKYGTNIHWKHKETLNIIYPNPK